MTKWCVERFSNANGWTPIDGPVDIYKARLGRPVGNVIETVTCRDIATGEEAARIRDLLAKFSTDDRETHVAVNVEFGSGLYDYKGAGSIKRESCLFDGATISLDVLNDADRRYIRYGFTIAGRNSWYDKGLLGGGNIVTVNIGRDPGDETPILSNWKSPTPIPQSNFDRWSER